MKSIPLFDDRYPIRTVYTDSTDWQRHDGWQNRDTRNAVLRDYLDTPLKRIAYAPEAHSGNVLAVSDEGDFVGEARVADAVGSTGEFDALVTETPGILLCIWTADCLPLFLYDPEKHVAAIAHCGWRSICNGIVTNTVDVMAGRFDTDPQNIIAAFGPGICGKCYEVGDELVEAFTKRFSSEDVRSIFTSKAKGKHLLDLRKAVSLELFGMDIQKENVHDLSICSFESEDYSSYRRNGPSDFGRQTLSGIVLT